MLLKKSYRFRGKFLLDHPLTPSPSPPRTLLPFSFYLSFLHSGVTPLPPLSSVPLSFYPLRLSHASEPSCVSGISAIQICRSLDKLSS